MASISCELLASYNIIIIGMCISDSIHEIPKRIGKFHVTRFCKLVLLVCNHSL